MRWLLLLIGLHATSLGAAPRVIASIAPLQEITAAIMQGVGEPVALIDADASPHHFALKPSQMRLLESADLVIWIDRHFESGLAGLPGILPPRVRRLELLPALGADADDDGHFWFSPRRLRAAVDLVRDALARVDPGRADIYAANAARLDGDIDRWRDGLAQALREKPLAVLTDHAFLSALAAEFDGLDVEAVHDRHDSPGGIRRLRELEDWLRRSGARCLLTQHSGTGSLARQFARKFDLAVIDVDARPRGASGGIVDRLERLRAALARCAAA